MRSLVFLCVCCVAAADADLSGFERQPGQFLASLARHGVASSSGGAAGEEYERETQAPMVWLNLHKSNLNAALLSPTVAYEDYASQRLGEGHFE